MPVVLAVLVAARLLAVVPWKPCVGATGVVDDSHGLRRRPDRQRPHELRVAPILQLDRLQQVVPSLLRFTQLRQFLRAPQFQREQRCVGRAKQREKRRCRFATRAIVLACEPLCAPSVSHTA